MLKIINKLSEIDFRQLMDVYEESNRLNGLRLYSKFSENLQVLYAEQDFYNYLQQYFRVPTARYAIWVDQGRYVSALRIEPYNDGLLLNALETAFQVRCRGYAKILVLSLLDDLQRQGSGIVYSHVHKNNLPSLNIHLSCGFRIISENAVYLDGTVQPDSYTLSLIY